ncbi:ParB N-terminal domain-containing protein [Sulfolobus tengchongensis]|uniref:ParB N-terminal domain-containing protein n=1 Tax=Sulfolobus tengchongensis TaxID=207809 RepID=A0AAX4KY76_9CREN
MERPKNLIPHEDVIIEKVIDISMQLQRLKTIKPIVVDENTHVILDGHHRYTAALRVSLPKIPVIYVDYKSPSIHVNVWYRKFSKPQMAKIILSSINTDGNICAKYEDVSICADSIYKLYWKLEIVESFLFSLGISVEKDLIGHLVPPAIDKQHIIDIANRGLRFPPKTTRHVYEFIIPQKAISIDDT